MNPPEVKPAAGFYLLRWPEGITARLDHFREDSRYNLSAEITITVSMPGIITGLVHPQTRLNLTSTRSRYELVKALRSRVEEVEGFLDWSIVVDQTCVKVLEHYRSGELLIKLREKPPEITERSFLIRPILLEHQANMIYGPGGSGKSLLALYLATLRSEGISENTLEVKEGKSLILDYETDAEEQEIRAWGLSKTLGIEEPSNIFYRFSSQPLVAEIEEIHRLVIEQDITLIIVDSVGLACGGEPEKAGVVTEYFRALRSLRITSLSIDHMVKNEHGKKATPFGSVYKSLQVRQSFEVRAAISDDNRLHMALFHDKKNNIAPLPPMGFVIDFEDDLIAFTAEKVRNVPELAVRLPLVDRLEIELQRGLLDINELSARLETSPGTIRQTLNRYKDKRFLKQGASWGLLVK